MRIETHMANSLQRCGAEGRDIHLWIDALFDHSAFAFFRWSSLRLQGFDPYAHRQHRHCREALTEALQQFAEHYDAATIEAVFLSHLSDDYNGYIPTRADFADPNFLAKYHR